MIRPLVYHGERVLHEPSEEVAVVDGSVRALIDDLVDTLYSTSGIGLAAPQIGVNKRVFVYDPHRVAGRRNFQVLINPKITSREGSVVSEREGCLSAPGLEVDVPRAVAVHVEGLDANGKPVSVEAKDFTAIVIQHEMDHLEGRLLSDRVEGERRAEFEHLLARLVAQHTSAWYVENLKAIQQRLDPVAQRADGILHTQRKGGNDLVVEKSKNLLELSVRTQGASNDERVAALLNLIAPLDLLQLRSQAMMLSLLWKPEPSQICLCGFGGGRLPMVFRQHYPEVVIDAVEPDADMILLARRFFGIQLDNRLHVSTANWREYFNQLGDVKYDAILLDRDGAGTNDSYSTWTREFYELCKSHLTDTGVVVSTFSADESLGEEKVITFGTSFRHAFQFWTDASRIVFGSDVGFDLPNALERIGKHYIPHNFTISELAATLLPLSLDETRSASILHDTDRDQFMQDLSVDDSLFRNVGRNDPCPCGSGKKFKKCHAVVFSRR